VTEETYWRRLKKTGWLKYLPIETQPGVRAAIAKNLRSDPNHAYLALTQGGIEAGCFSAKEILKELARTSRNVFHPVDIRENESKEILDLSFTFNKTKYASSMPADPSSIWDETLSLANKSLAENRVEERFIVLPGVDAWLNLTFIPPNVYRKACAEKLLPGKKPGVFFVGADPDEAAHVARRKLKAGKWQGRGPQWPWFYLADCDLESIYVLLRSAVGKDNLVLTEICFDASNGVTAYRVPDNVAQKLAKFPYKRMRAPVKVWVETSSVKDYCDDVTFLTDMFAEACAVAQEAHGTGKGLLVCFGNLRK
jgi:hypothetical protein